MSVKQTLADLIRRSETPMSPEGTGTVPYETANPPGGSGTHEPMAQPGDDVPDSTRQTFGEYLVASTTGIDSMTEANFYPVENPDATTISLNDPVSGRPNPPTPLDATQPGFANPASANPDVIEGFNLLESLGFFNDSEVDTVMGPDRQSSQENHDLLLNSSIPTTVSSVLSSNRFTTSQTDRQPHTTPDSPHAFKVPQIPHQYNDSLIPQGTFVSPDMIPNGDFIGGDLPPGVDPTDLLHWDSMNVLDKVAHEAAIGAVQTAIAAPAVLGIRGVRQRNLDNLLWGGPGALMPYKGPFGTKAHKKVAKKLVKILNRLEDDLIDGLVGVVQTVGDTSDTEAGVVQSKGWKLEPGVAYRRRGKSWNRDLRKPSANDFQTAGGGPDNSTLMGKITPPFGTFSTSYHDFGRDLFRLWNVPFPVTTMKSLGYNAGGAGFDNFLKFLIRSGFAHLRNILGRDAFATLHLRAGVHKFLEADDLFSGAATALSTATSWPSADQSVINNILFSFRETNAIKLLRLAVHYCEVFYSSGMNMSPAFGNLDGVTDINLPGWRLARSRYKVTFPTQDPFYQKPDSGTDPFSVKKIPSMMILPKAFVAGFSNPDVYGLSAPSLEHNDQQHGFMSLLAGVTAGTELDTDTGAILGIHDKLGRPNNPGAKRFSPQEVKYLETVLEAEHVPFYFHDVRTNEIISFYAFLESLSDSYSPGYKASGGFGRIEEVQIYEKTSRSISLTFTIAAMGQDDIDEMYWKINKLVTMVYPQWSRGTMLEMTSDAGVTRFTMPFSQIPTATPLCRLRVGDLIKSNYSRRSVARLMGIQDPNFQIGNATIDIPAGIYKQTDPPNHNEPTPISVIRARIEGGSPAPAGSTPGIVPVNADGTYNPDVGWPVGCRVRFDPWYPHAVSYDASSQSVGSNFHIHLKPQFTAEIVEYLPITNDFESHGDLCVRIKKIPGGDELTNEGNEETLVLYTDILPHVTTAMIEDTHNLDKLGYERRVADTFDNAAAYDEMKAMLFGDKNPIFKSFESGMGRGLAGVITSIDLDWKLNEINWELESPNSVAPMACTVSVSFQPIHDIAPGIDSDGVNRAPVYNVGGSSGQLGGDPWDGTGGDAGGTPDATVDQQRQWVKTNSR